LSINFLNSTGKYDQQGKQQADQNKYTVTRHVWILA
jgi:hypothetical protein